MDVTRYSYTHKCVYAMYVLRNVQQGTASMCCFSYSTVTLFYRYTDTCQFLSALASLRAIFTNFHNFPKHHNKSSGDTILLLLSRRTCSCRCRTRPCSTWPARLSLASFCSSSRSLALVLRGRTKHVFCRRFGVRGRGEQQRRQQPPGRQ